MELLTLRYFVDICRSQNISRSAQHLFISRQALSKSMINLEKELGMQLLIREHSGIKLTPAGKRLFEASQHILSIWDDAYADIKQINAIEQRTIRVGFGQITFTLWNGDHDQQFTSIHPDIHIESQIAMPDALRAALLNDELDVAITHSFQSAEFKRTLIAPCPSIALMRSDDPLAQVNTMHLSDLNGRIVIFRPGNSEFSTSLTQLLQNEHIQFIPELLPDANIAIVLQAIREKHGVYITTRKFLDILGKTTEFIAKYFASDDRIKLPSRDIYAITLKHQQHMSDIHAYIRFLKATIKK